MHQIRRLDSAQWLLSGVSFISSLGIAVMLPLIPLYAVSLGATPTQLGLLTSAFALANAAGQLVAGVLLDRVGARGFIRSGIATHAGANTLIATAATAPSLIAYRSLAGVGAGVNLVATRLYLVQVADPGHLAFVNGVHRCLVRAAHRPLAGRATRRTFGVVTAISQLGTVAGAMAASAVWQRAGLNAAMLTTTISVSLGGAVLLLLPSKTRRE